MSLAQKQHFNYNLNRFVDQKIFQNLFGRGQALPAKVVAVISPGIVKVSLQLANTGFVLPLITCAVAESKYVLLPIQVGDLGRVTPSTVNIGNITGLGTGTPDFSTPGNLASLVFEPVANALWISPDGNAVVIGGPNGAIIRTLSGSFTVTVNSSGITLAASAGGASITLDGSGNVDINGTLKINGNLYTAHVHSGVTTGSGDTGGVV